MSEDISLRLITWNVAGSKPPSDLTELLSLKSSSLPSVVAIGLQEMDVAATQLANDYIYDDPWTNAITKALNARNFIELKSIRLWGIHLTVYVKKQVLIYVTNVEASYTRTGFGGLWGNKGGVSIRMDICGVNMCFVNCHLTAHAPNVASRLADYDAIIDTQTFRDIPTILDHDYVFWLGDLNFRLDELPKKEVEDRIAKKDYEYLWQFDQLKKAMKEELILVGFEEAALKFPCTYKYDKGTQVYDTSKKQRKPGYCDRILWMSQKESLDGFELRASNIIYTSLQDYTNSDHKPVVAEIMAAVMRHPPLLPVMFEPMDHWCSTDDVKCSYTIPTVEHTVQPWDWVGLYQSTYKTPRDYSAYTWAPVKGDDMGDGTIMYEVTFQKEYLKSLNGTYCLCYYSAERDCVIGYSDTFKISESDEDDSSDESLPIGAVGGGEEEDFDDEEFVLQEEDLDQDSD